METGHVVQRVRNMGMLLIIVAYGARVCCFDFSGFLMCFSMYNIHWNLCVKHFHFFLLLLLVSSSPPSSAGYFAVVFFFFFFSPSARLLKKQLHNLLEADSIVDWSGIPSILALRYYCYFSLSLFIVCLFHSDHCIAFSCCEYLFSNKSLSRNADNT